MSLISGAVQKMAEKRGLGVRAFGPPGSVGSQGVYRRKRHVLFAGLGILFVAVFGVVAFLWMRSGIVEPAADVGESVPPRVVHREIATPQQENTGAVDLDPGPTLTASAVRRSDEQVVPSRLHLSKKKARLQRHGAVAPRKRKDERVQVVSTSTTARQITHAVSADDEQPTVLAKAGLVHLHSETIASVLSEYRKGVSYQKEGRWQDAIEAYQRVLSQEPASAEVYNNLGVCYEKLGELKIAAQSYEKAISIEPRLASSYNNLGIVFYLLKDYEKARNAYRRALQLDPDNSQSQVNLALVYKRLGRLDLARRTFEQVLAREADNPAAHYNLARLLDEQGDNEAALPHYLQFLAVTSTAYPQLREAVRVRVGQLQADMSRL